MRKSKVIVPDFLQIVVGVVGGEFGKDFEIILCTQKQIL